MIILQLSIVSLISNEGCFLLLCLIEGDVIIPGVCTDNAMSILFTLFMGVWHSYNFKIDIVVKIVISLLYWCVTSMIMIYDSKIILSTLCMFAWDIAYGVSLCLYSLVFGAYFATLGWGTGLVWWTEFHC